MRRIDMLIGGVLVVAIIASAIGALAYEDVRGVQTFRVSWDLRDTPLAEESGSMAGAGETTWSFAMSEPNVTSILVEVRVDGGAPRVQDVAGRVEVTPPNGTPVAVEFTLPASPTGAGQTIPVEVPLGAVPDASDVEARSREEAIALALPANATTAGFGEWTIVLTLSSTAPGPLAGTYAVSYVAVGRALDGEATTQLPDVGR